MKLLTAILLTACASLQAITIDRFFIGSEEVSLPFSQDNLDSPFLDPNFSIRWSWESNTLAGHMYARGSEFVTSATAFFTLTEPLNFFLLGRVRQFEWLPESFTSLDVSFNLQALSASVLDLGGDDLSLTGRLDPGQYVFASNGFAYSTESDSFLTLAFTPVTDAGSTLLFLSLAFCAILCLKSLRPQTSN